MKYLKRDGNEYLENGNSKVRVGFVCHKPDPIVPERTVKVLEVLEVIRDNPENPIIPGHHIAVSFPNDKLGSRNYVWGRGGEDWPAQVPLQINDRKADAITRHNLSRAN